ncbi:hypothetical protein ATANTOWER_022691, partial [Ataeniobius toweri]|nr:hypothetical protein [Ataeniobius toweri]
PWNHNSFGDCLDLLWTLGSVNAIQISSKGSSLILEEDNVMDSKEVISLQTTAAFILLEKTDNNSIIYVLYYVSVVMSALSLQDEK